MNAFLKQRWAVRRAVGLDAMLMIGVLVTGPASASAARITWSDAIDSGTNLPINTGRIVEAVNVGGGAITINGITFKDGDGGADYTSNLLEAFPECCEDNGAPTGASPEMAQMLDSHRWLDTGFEAAVGTLRLDDLDIGEDYMLQVYYSDFRPGDVNTYFWMGGGGASATFTRGTTEENVSFVGTFTADADMQNVHLVPDGTTLDGFVNHDPGLQGYVLSRVPEGTEVPAAGAPAANITWSDPIESADFLPVNNGHVIEAVNSAGPAVTINGIEFKDGDIGGDINHSNLVDAYPSCCSDNGAPSGFDEDMEVMLDSHRWAGSGGKASVATLVLEGLTPGEQYTIQPYFSDFRPGSFKEYYYAGDNGSISQLWRRGTTEDNVSFIGTFTAESDQQRVHMVPNGTRFDGFVNHDPGLSGYVLSLVAGDQTPLQAGDADQDLDFDQLDLVQVQIAAKYLTEQAATWGDGDWDGAPGGEPGDPPAGDGLFDQRDIIQALGANLYLMGPYAALDSTGITGDGQTSIVYDPRTGEVSVDAPAGAELTSINVDSAAGIFTAEPAQNLGGSFDNDADNNMFKATFGGSFGSLSFGNIAQPGLQESFVLGDLSVVGSLAGGGDLGAVDFIYVPEASTVLLLALGAFSFFGYLWRRG